MAKLLADDDIELVELLTKLLRLEGLELGVDDYLSKPFNDRELATHIKSILRRTVKNSAEIPKSNVKDSGMIEYAGITLQTGSQQAFFAGQNLCLTGTEFALLQILITYRGQVLSREYLNMKVLNKTLTPFDRAIDMHMSNLRKKLPPKADGSPWFKTLRGRGYLFISEQH